MHAIRLFTARLILEPLRVSDAARMVEVLSDPALYRFTGGEPPGIQTLTARYARQVVGHSADGRESWLNWIVTGTGADDRGGADPDGADPGSAEPGGAEQGPPFGFVQATVTGQGEAGLTAEIAWLISPAQQGRGLGAEAAGAIQSWLSDALGITRFVAHIHPDHAASEAVARRLGLRPTPAEVDGERRWEAGSATLA